MARDDAYVLGRLDGGLGHAERLSRQFGRQTDGGAAALVAFVATGGRHEQRTAGPPLDW